MDLEQKTALENLLNTASSWAYGIPVPSINIPASQNSLSPTTKTSEPTQATIIQTEAHSIKTIETIAEKIASCTRCDLHKTRTKAVTGIGVNNPIVLVIGEAPSQEEDMQGIPFLGPAGQLLDKMLEAINLSRNTNCYIANIVKCRPPLNRDPLQSESDACSSFLQAQITLLKPTMILAVGRIAAQTLLETTEEMGKLHGNIFDYPPNNQTSIPSIPLMATYHPSVLLRDPTYKKPAWEDLKLFKSMLEELSGEYVRSLNTQTIG